EQHHLIRRIEVPYVLLDLLPVPFQMAGLGIECEDRIGVEVVTLPVRIDEILPRIAGAVEDRVRLRVVLARHPRAPPPVFAGRAMTILWVVLDSVEFPHLLAALGFDTVDFPLRCQFAGSRAESQHVAGNDRRRGEIATVAVRKIGQLDLPYLLAGFLIEGNATPIHGSDEDLAVADRDATPVG